MPTYLIPRDVTRLAREVRASELSLPQIAERAGVTRQYLRRLVNGERLRFNATAAAVVEQTLGVAPGELFQLESDELDLTPYLPEDAA